MKKFLILFMLIASPALAEEQCPADRPNKVKIQSLMQTCTSVMCISKLQCNEKNECIHLPSNDCNTCVSSSELRCLSDDELNKAKQK